MLVARDTLYLNYAMTWVYNGRWRLYNIKEDIMRKNLRQLLGSLLSAVIVIAFATTCAYAASASLSHVCSGKLVMRP